MLDWKYPDVSADSLAWSKAQCGVDTPEDVRRIGYAVVAGRDTPGGRYVVCVREGYYHLARYVRPGRCDGRHLVEIARTDIRYHDDDEIVTPA